MSMRKNLLTRAGIITSLITLSIATTGCGGSEPSSTPEASPSVSQSAAQGSLTVTNCDEDVSYDGQRHRIVATSNSANIGTLLKVGALDNLAAVALQHGNDAVFDALYGEGIADVPRLESPIAMEAIVANDPDLLIGSYSGLFSGSSGITPDSAAEMGIPTYIISDSCRQNPEQGEASALGTMDPWDAVRADVTNYGILTGNEDEAKAALAELDERLAALEDAPQADNPPKILLFDSGTDELYTSGRNGPPQGIIEAAGGKNVFETEDTTWFKASWEAVAETKPDVIVVMDYRKGDENEVPSKIETIRSQPALANLDVVEKNHIVVLPLALFTSGYPNIEAAEQLRAALEDFGYLPETDIEGELPADMGYGPIS